MKGKINRDWYCTGYANDPCPDKDSCSGCLNYHRKWPTPEQFKEEYGEEYPEGGLYFVRSDYPLEEHRDGSWGEWKTDVWTTGMTYDHSRVQVVCACTPWGKPPNDWRPE